MLENQPGKNTTIIKPNNGTTSYLAENFLEVPRKDIQAIFQDPIVH